MDEAIEKYQEVVEEQPGRQEAWYNIGNALCVKKDYPGAVDAYQKAIFIDEKSAPSWYNLGNAFYL